VAAASALHRRTGEAAYDDWHRTWWAWIDAHLRDIDRGSWHHELDSLIRPAASVWPGKPDLYHAVQATLLPRLPLAPTLATALARGLLERP
jgi:mannose/cellobiose epimerase-like protein (N-acyl-D-glucosamine 2-epimerase family)